MTLIEGELSRGASLLDRMIRSLTVTRRSIEGQARLMFADGRSCIVRASVDLCRSSLSSSGEGYMHCAAEFGFDALHSSDWPTLTFGCGATLEIDVVDVKARDGQCRCRFEVKS